MRASARGLNKTESKVKCWWKLGISKGLVHHDGWDERDDPWIPEYDTSSEVSPPQKMSHLSTRHDEYRPHLSNFVQTSRCFKPLHLPC